MLKYIIALFGLIAFSAIALADYQNVVRVVDGDTVNLEDRRRVRIVGMDAPELRGKCPEEIDLAIRARARMVQLVSQGVLVQVVPRSDKYGRTLAILFDRQGRNVSDVMIQEGLALAYNGRGTRPDWCNILLRTQRHDAYNNFYSSNPPN